MYMGECRHLQKVKDKRTRWRVGRPPSLGGGMPLFPLPLSFLSFTPHSLPTPKSSISLCSSFQKFELLKIHHLIKDKIEKSEKSSLQDHQVEVLSLFDFH
jgi:hypothetical protein